MDIVRRDFAPVESDLFFRRNGERAVFVRVVAHYPGFVVNARPGSPSVGVWEVAVDGVRKPEIVISVYWGGRGSGALASTTANVWYEVPSR